MEMLDTSSFTVTLNDIGEKQIEGMYNGEFLSQTVPCNGNGIILFNSELRNFFFLPLEINVSPVIQNDLLVKDGAQSVGMVSDIPSEDVVSQPTQTILLTDL